MVRWWLEFGWIASRFCLLWVWVCRCGVCSSWVWVLLAMVGAMGCFFFGGGFTGGIDGGFIGWWWWCQVCVMQ